MKKRSSILYIGFLMILVISVLLNIGSILMSYSFIGNQALNEVELTPKLDIDFYAFSTQEDQIRRKYEIYTFQRVEGDDNIIEIYSKDQVAEINKQKNSGVVFPITTKELVFLLHDTVDLFYENDIIRITDKDGTTHEFLGIDYYTSADYLDNFKGLDIGRTDISYNINADIFFTLKTRLEVLCSFYQSYGDITYFIANATQPLKESEMDFLCSRIEMVNFGQYHCVYEEFESLTKIALDGFRFADGKILFFHNLTQQTPSTNEAFPSGSAPYEAGKYKYDSNGKVVVIEVYRKWSQDLVARIRFDSKNNLDTINEICDILNENRSYFKHSDSHMPSVLANYRIAVYFNGIPFLHEGARDRAIVFDPDGDMDLFAFTDGNDIFYTRNGYYSGGIALNTYIFELVLDNIHQ